MKKILLVLAVALMAFSAYATAPAFSATNATYEFEVDTTISSGNAFDTIAATTDTVTLFSKRVIEQRCEYAFVANLSGTNNLAAALPAYIEARVYDGSNNLMYTIHVDSLVDENGEPELIQLQVGAKVIGAKWDLRIHCHSDPGTLSFNKMYLLQRRPVNIDKKW